MSKTELKVRNNAGDKWSLYFEGVVSVKVAKQICKIMKLRLLGVVWMNTDEE